MTIHSNQPIAYIRSSEKIDKHEFESLMALVASARTAASNMPPPALKQGLMAKVHLAKARASDKFTARPKTLNHRQLAPGVNEKTLYRTGQLKTRPGEPTHARVVSFAPNTKITSAEIFAGIQDWGLGQQIEFLVLSGSVILGGQALALRDYQIRPSDCPIDEIQSEFGAVLYIRESKINPPDSLTQPQTVKDSADNWPDYAPGIKRRVLWHSNGIAAMLYLTQPHANVPLHSHTHDEECLMVQGELYLDDTLLLEGDYQLAPSGSKHQITQTETGVVLFAHGDLDLAFE
jgi:quercetin dioxygenase-like cupin family protein